MLRTLLLAALLLLPLSLQAGDYKPDDTLSVALSTEGWVTTKTARVIVQVNAAVSGENAGSTRDTMIKAVNALGDGEWRLINFSRNQSDTGLENWYAQFENRLPEAALNGLNEKMKKASKPGMQLSVAGIDFTPTLAEYEAVKATLRKTLIDMANAELKSMQAAFPDRGYRISNMSFDFASSGGGMMDGMQQRMAAPMMAKMAEMDSTSSEGGVQTAQKITLSTNVTFSALAPTTATPAK